MEAVQLSLFDYSVESEQIHYSPIKYLTRVYWDNILHAISQVVCFCVVTGAIIVASATGVADSRQKTVIESIVERRRRRAMHEGKTIYLAGIGVNNEGKIVSIIDTVHNDN